MEENNYWKGWGIYRPNKLTQLSIVYRIAKKYAENALKYFHLMQQNVQIQNVIILI